MRVLYMHSTNEKTDLSNRFRVLAGTGFTKVQPFWGDCWDFLVDQNIPQDEYVWLLSNNVKLSDVDLMVQRAAEVMSDPTVATYAPHCPPVMLKPRTLSDGLQWRADDVSRRLARGNELGLVAAVSGRALAAIGKLNIRNPLIGYDQSVLVAKAIETAGFVNVRDFRIGAELVLYVHERPAGQVELEWLRVRAKVKALEAAGIPHVNGYTEYEQPLVNPFMVNQLQEKFTALMAMTDEAYAARIAELNAQGYY